MTTKQILYGIFIKGGRWIVFIPVLYFAVAMTTYRIRHKEKTETQLFFDIPKAICFK